MRREEAEALVAQGAEAVLGVVRSLEERIEELERRLSRDSTNSSLPPSRDPPLTRQQRRALARERAKASLRKPGGSGFPASLSKDVLRNGISPLSGLIIRI